MTDVYGKGIELEGELTVDKSRFDLGSLDDELRVDGLCQKLLKRFYLQLLENGETPEKATLLANGADYFLRDFVVAIKQRNIFTELPGLVRQFAGNWYIVSNIDPSVSVLSGHLQGIKAFYRYLHDKHLISPEYFQQLARECDDLAYYDSRIDSFWAITGDGYLAWERECSLKEG